jgi:MIP family channel proteins
MIMTLQAVRGTRKDVIPGVPSRLPALAAEVFGTFVLTLSGTATLLAAAQISHSTIPTVAIQIAVSVAFGFGILAAVYTVATISGAHINPAVTFGLAAAREFPWRLVPAYCGAQLLGGILAALVNWGIFGDKLASALDLGTTHPGPGVSLIAALFAEFVLTAVLLIVVLSTAVYQRAPGGAMPAGLAIGLWIGAAVFLAFPVSGGSLNPARTLGPDIVSAAFPSWWIYLIGPLAGGAFGGWIWHYLKQGRQPADAESPAGQADEDSTAGQAARHRAGAPPARQRAGKFLLEKTAAGKYRFTLVASNGQVIATSTDYERRQAALSGIESVKRNAPGADIASQDSV